MSGSPIVWDLRTFPHLPAHPMTGIHAGEKVSLAFSTLLNSCTNVAKAVANTQLGDAHFQALFGDVDQSPGFRRNLSNPGRESCITYKPFEGSPAVNRYDVAFFKFTLSRVSREPTPR